MFGRKLITGNLCAIFGLLFCVFSLRADDRESLIASHRAVMARWFAQEVASVLPVPAKIVAGSCIIAGLLAPAAFVVYGFMQALRHVHPAANIAGIVAGIAVAAQLANPENFSEKIDCAARTAQLGLFAYGVKKVLIDGSAQNKIIGGIGLCLTGALYLLAAWLSADHAETQKDTRFQIGAQYEVVNGQLVRIK